MFGKVKVDKERKPVLLHAVCYYCKKTDFCANMINLNPSYTVFGDYAHKECLQKACGVIDCPHCNGTGEVDG